MEYNEDFESQEDIPENSAEFDRRSKAFRRHKDRTKKQRRRKIVDLKCWEPVADKHIFSVSLRYHPAKTNNKGKRRRKPGNWHPAKLWNKKDRQRIESMQDDVKDYDAE